MTKIACLKNSSRRAKIGSCQYHFGVQDIITLHDEPVTAMAKGVGVDALYSYHPQLYEILVAAAHFQLQ